MEPLCQRELTWASTPAVDIVEKDKAYEVTAELPGMDEKQHRGQSRERNADDQGREEGREGGEEEGLLSLRAPLRLLRALASSVPEGVDSNKIEANFKKGVLTVTLPKTVEAQAAEKKITVKAG